MRKKPSAHRKWLIVARVGTIDKRQSYTRARWPRRTNVSSELVAPQNITPLDRCRGNTRLPSGGQNGTSSSTSRRRFVGRARTISQNERALIDARDDDHFRRSLTSSPTRTQTSSGFLCSSTLWRKILLHNQCVWFYLDEQIQFGPVPVAWRRPFFEACTSTKIVGWVGGWVILLAQN